MVLHGQRTDRAVLKDGADKQTATSRVDVEALVRPMLESMGYALVRLVVSGRERPTLQIMAERQDDKPMSLTDCETISRTLSAKLDVEDPIPTAYTLEVSSPGLDRPLTRPQDYQRFRGAHARIETHVGKDGRRRFTGPIAAADADSVTIETVDGAYTIAYADIARARLSQPEKTGRPPKHPRAKS
jgi:ribosome maturation factor RimP